MHLDTKIGFLGGGRMGEALIQGIRQAELTAPEDILAMDPAGDRREHLALTYGVTATSSPDRIWQECGIVILAVKPQIMQEVLAVSRSQATAEHLVISIAAGITLEMLAGGLEGTGCRLIRTMPNTPALVQEAATAISAGFRATDRDLETAETIFGAIGKTVRLEEKYLNAVTGLSGSGPAYVFSFLEAMIDAGLKVGLNRADAETLVLQTVLGSVKLALETGQHPAQLRAMVTSPGGTTIAGLHRLAAAGFHGLIIDAVEAAAIRAEELGDAD